MDLTNPYSAPNPEPAEDPPLVAQLAVDGEGMTVDYEQTFEDLMLITEYSWRQKRSYWNQFGWMGLALWLLALLFLPDGFLRQRDWAASVILLMCGAVLVAIWFQIVFIPRVMVRQALKREYTGNKNLNVIGLRRLTITPEFIIASSPLMQSAQRWTGIEKVIIYENTILIFNSALSAFVLPRRGFNSDTHFHEFANQSQKYLAAHAADGTRIPMK